MYPQYSLSKFSGAVAVAGDFPGDLGSPEGPPLASPEIVYQLMAEQAVESSEVSHNSCSSTGCSSYGSPSSLASQGTQAPSNCTHSSVMQRSISSQSLHRNNTGTHHHPLHALLAELLDDSHKCPRINGIMHHNRHSESPLSSESSMIIEGMSRAYPYSPEEKKVRIERYRIKRNQRNFNKKIKYACRKTLADSRPRVRGRFAKNEGTEKKSHHIGNIGEEEEDENWANFFETLVVANLVQEP
ncbi:zinc finger protein CONSTANS-like [Senna tora]|uniref:Zinc finger protein CONSTANS-like n=1 Tax=Senna tora TaxID=362788 RepID=A0A834TT81_9FABA|nr:zinc finger protein CONSTANS-like [Senna tora]